MQAGGAVRCLVRVLGEGSNGENRSRRTSWLGFPIIGGSRPHFRIVARSDIDWLAEAGGE